MITGKEKEQKELELGKSLLEKNSRLRLQQLWMKIHSLVSFLFNLTNEEDFTGSFPMAVSSVFQDP
jgi:hypothetical protein